MRTEVCVVVYENQDTIGALIESLVALGPNIGLAVHDNGPGARTLDIAATLATAAGLLFRGERCSTANCGFAAGCNALARGSEAHDLLFLNPDATVQAWPVGLTSDGRIVGAAIVDDAGRPALSSGQRRTLRDELDLRWLRRKPAPAAGTGYVSGAALLVAAETFNGLGGFDEGYFMYYEDIDLCARAGEAGVPVVVEPTWRVRHTGGHSVGRSADGLRTALLRSYESGRRFHAGRSQHLALYDLLCLADSALRVLLGVKPSRRTSARAHAAVVARAVRLLAKARRGASS